MSSKLMDLPAEGVVAQDSGEFLENIKVIRSSKDQFNKAHSTDAGYDILAANSGVIPANSSMLLNTELFVSIPKGYVGIIKSRSGLSVKQGIDVGAGVIDAGYTGEVKVLLRNTHDKWFDFEVGDKIAQMVIVPICKFNVIDVKSLGNTERNSNGFGSSGV